MHASAAIPAGTVLDVCPVLVLDPAEARAHVSQTSLHDYTYNWPVLPGPAPPPPPHSTAGGGRPAQTTQAVVFGLGSMFNHSRLRQNVGWTRDLERRLVVYRALRDVAAGEELCISYGSRLTFVDTDGEDGEEGEERAEDVLGRIEIANQR